MMGETNPKQMSSACWSHFIEDEAAISKSDSFASQWHYWLKNKVDFGVTVVLVEGRLTLSDSVFDGSYLMYVYIQV